MTIYIKFAGEPIFGNQAIAAIVGPPGPGTEQTYFDAGLIEQPTLAALNEFLVTESVAAVHPFVDEASTSASTSTNAANEAAEAQAEAEAAALRAETAAQTALFGNIYADYATGLAATTIGQQWVSYGPEGSYATRYLKTGASAATFQDAYPNKSALDRVTDNIVLTETGPTAFGDGYGGNMFDMAGGPDRDLPRAPAMQIGDTVISSDERTVDFEESRLAARGFVMGGVNVTGDGDRPFGIADDYGASLVDMKGGPLAQSLRVSGGIQFDGIYLAEGPGDWIGASDPYGGWRRLAWFDELPDASVGGTGGDYAARDASNVAFSMALATKPIAVVQKPKRGAPGKIVVNITATNGQSHSRSARGYPCLTLAWAIYADEYVFSFGEASRPASSTGTTYDPLTSAEPYPLRAVAHINSTKQSNAQLQAQGPDQAIPGEGYEISANYWLRKECLAKWSAEDGTPVTEDPNTHFMTLACGVGGQPLAALLEGAPENYYNRYKTGLIAIRDWYVAEYGAENVEFVVIALDIAHGQETYSELPGGAHNTEALYRTGLQQYRGQMIATIQEVFGNDQLPPATFVGQASGGYVKDGSDLHVGRAQLKLCTDVPGWFWGQPDYPYVNLPSAHPDSNGYRQQGQYRGDAWSQVLLHDRAPKRVYMRGATWDSATNEVVIDMVSTDGPLTTGSPRDGFVPKVMADLGLCVRDSVGLIALENVRFVGAMTIAATPVRTPTEAPMVIAGSKAIANGYVGIRCPATITALENYTLIANAGQHPDANQPDLVDKPYNLDTWCANGAVQAEEI